MSRYYLTPDGEHGVSVDEDHPAADDVVATMRLVHPDLEEVSVREFVAAEIQHRARRMEVEG